eukprot:SAG11_NODE_1306_length_5245_cov_6.023513_2_plen_123_part_00
MCVAPGFAAPTRQKPSGGPTSLVVGWLLMAVWLASTSTGGSKTILRTSCASALASIITTAMATRSCNIISLVLGAASSRPGGPATSVSASKDAAMAMPIYADATLHDHSCSSCTGVPKVPPK